MPRDDTFGRGWCLKLPASAFLTLTLIGIQEDQVRSMSVGAPLTHHHPLQSSHVTLFSRDFEVSVNDPIACQQSVRKLSDRALRDSEKDTGATTERTQKVAGYRQCANASSAKSSSGRDNPFQFLVHALLSVSSHDQSLLFELFCNVPGRGSRNLNPSLRKDSTSNNNEGHVDCRVNRVQKGFGKIEWW